MKDVPLTKPTLARSASMKRQKQSAKERRLSSDSITNLIAGVLRVGYLTNESKCLENV